MTFRIFHPSLIMMLGMLSMNCYAGTSVARLSQENAALLLNQMSEVCRAADERMYAIGQQTSRVFHSRSGSPSSVVHAIKVRIGSLTPAFVDNSLERNGSYNHWFDLVFTNAPGQPGVSRPSDFPYWRVTNLLNHLNLPLNSLGVTPASGYEIMIAETTGLRVCSRSLGLLRQQSIKTFSQMNAGGTESFSTSQQYSVYWYDEYRCVTNHCTSRNDTVSVGQPVTLNGCVIPSAQIIGTNYKGRSVWEISYTGSHQKNERQNADDYSCLGGSSYTRSGTRSLLENSSISYTRKFTTDITLICTNLARDVKGSLKPYSRYVYTPLGSQVITNSATIGCEDVLCEKHDEDGNVIGMIKCGVREVDAPRVFAIEGWQPGLPTSYISSGNSQAKGTNQSTLAISMPAVPDPFSNLEPALTFEEEFNCDGVINDYAFGLWCYGRIGYTAQSMSCSVKIPLRRLEFEVRPLLLEAQFDYCP